MLELYFLWKWMILFSRVIPDEEKNEETETLEKSILLERFDIQSWKNGVFSGVWWKVQEGWNLRTIGWVKRGWHIHEKRILGFKGNRIVHSNSSNCGRTVFSGRYRIYLPPLVYEFPFVGCILHFKVIIQREKRKMGRAVSSNCFSTEMIAKTSGHSNISRFVYCGRRPFEADRLDICHPPNIDFGKFIIELWANSPLLYKAVLNKFTQNTIPCDSKCSANDWNNNIYSYITSTPAGEVNGQAGSSFFEQNWNLREIIG